MKLGLWAIAMVAYIALVVVSFGVILAINFIPHPRRTASLVKEEWHKYRSKT